MPALLCQFNAELAAYRARPWVVAYSGGVDSHVLLHLALRAAQQFSVPAVRAVHIHHGLQSAADQWQQHCQRVCADLGVPLTVRAVTVPQGNGDSVEQAARIARYAAFASELRADEVLLLGQHQEDQMETLLLQLLRGAGVKGLAAMATTKACGSGTLCRPLLTSARAAIMAYAQQHQLCWVEDDSNQDCRFARNRLRHEVIPLLQRGWPEAAANVARSASHCATADGLLTSIACSDLATVSVTPTALSIAGLMSLSMQRRINALRTWIQQAGYRLPDTCHWTQIEALLSSAGVRACVHWKGAELRCYQGQVYLMPALAAHDPQARWHWDLKADFSLPHDLGVLEAQATREALAPHALADGVWVRFRRPDDVIVLPGHAMRHSLKKRFSTWKIPPWLRDRVPVLEAGGRVVMVVGYAVAKP